MDYTIPMRAALRSLPVILVALLAPFSASAASLFLDPASAAYGPGDTFIVSVRIDPQGECMNAAHVELSYPPDELRVVDFTKGNSILSLWVGDPEIDNTTGRVAFSGGVPAGYCGRIPGDPSESDILGQVIFTVLKTPASAASVRILPASAVYLNDGAGTEAALTSRDALYALQATSTQATNPWVDQLSTDTTPPEPFTVQVESTKGVFGGAYYAVFSTVDKQSGLDHYEAFENGVWKRVTSPHVLADQLLRLPVEIKAVDKAGNERIGAYNASTTPARAGSGDLLMLVLSLALLFLILALRWLWERHVSAKSAPPVS